MTRKWLNTTSVDQHHDHISQLAFGTGHSPKVLIAECLKSILLNCRSFLFGHSLPRFSRRRSCRVVANHNHWAKGRRSEAAPQFAACLVVDRRQQPAWVSPTSQPDSGSAGIVGRVRKDRPARTSPVLTQRLSWSPRLRRGPPQT